MRSKSDREWQAESDASTLAEASKIAADKARMRRAIAASQKKTALVVKVDKKLRETFK